MAINTVTALKTFFQALRDGTGVVNDTDFFQKLVDVLESVGTVGGALVSRRLITAASPPTVAMSTVAAVINSGWNAEVGASGLTFDQALGRVIIGAGAEGTYLVIWKLAFRTSAAKTYGFALAASKGGAAPVLEQETVDEVTASATNTTYHASGFGFISSLIADDYVELRGLIDATTANLTPRQGIILLLRVR